MSRVRIRFAPSPTGRLHLGNARTALFNWLFARNRGGRMILRIEDTDRVRSQAEFEADLIENLQWLGLDWDEGPDKDGDFGPYRQAERLDIYAEYAARIEAAGKAYPCYCTEEELEAERRKARKSGRPPRYSGRCRRLTDKQRAALESEGRKPALRFVVEPGRLTVRDLLHGRIDFNAAEISDFIIVRSTGLPSYNFACVIDDHLMEISHVIRGEDHLANTPRQLLLYRFFGWTPPAFAHHSLLVGEDRAKLSKRHGATRVAQMRAAGIQPEALANYLAYIGGGLGKVANEVMSGPKLAQTFELTRLGRSSAVFDYAKLNWFNARHLAALDSTELARRLMDYLSQDALQFITESAREWLIRAVELARENADDLKKLAEWVLVLACGHAEVCPDRSLPLTEEAAAELARTGSDGLKVLAAALGSVGRDGWYDSLAETTGLKGKKLYHPLRLALTGRLQGPRLHDLVDFLTPDQIKMRLKAGIETIEESGES